jgi:hypothetical protein
LERRGRTLVCIDIDLEYLDLARRRLEAAESGAGSH